MKPSFRSVFPFLLTAACAVPAVHAAVPNRLAANAAQSEARDLPQGVSPRVRHGTMLGHLRADTQIQTLTLDLTPTAEQAAALDQLLVAQQDPASPSFHQWLTPEQFGERFGASDHDLRILQNWLTSQGLQVENVARSRNQITFSGSAAVVESAFHTELDRFHQDGQDFFENSTAPQIPAALQSIVSGIRGLSSFRLQPHSAKPVLRPDASPSGITAQNTSSSGTTHYVVPYDWRQIYNANGLYNSGYTGSGVGIAVVGQSAVDTAQVAYFQQLTGQSVKAPTLVLVPGTGTSTRYSGDEGESELDLEYATGVAPGAAITFVYTGSSTSAGVINSLQYAITNNIAPIISMSYAGCETANTLSAINGVESYLRQANAQGQTIVIASGDQGAAGCDTYAPAYDGAQVAYPSSSAYVSAIGGTTLNEGSGTYWTNSNNTQNGSALGYIPEVAWNDTATVTSSNPNPQLSSTGGGFSRVFSKPNWQTGVGVPADGARDIPDVSFASSSSHDPYLLCTSDTSYTGTNSRGQAVTGACTSTAFGSFVVGGTSVATPTFGGALAMIQSANQRTRMGNVNPLLYKTATSTPAVFHDVTSGSNIVPCASGTLGCVNGSVGYNATTGYDLATGLGSVDIGALSTVVLSASSSAMGTPTVAITVNSASTSTVSATVTVSSSVSSGVPTGTVTVSIDGGSSQTVTLGSTGTANVTFTGSFAAGSHTVSAAYSGNTTYTAGTSSATFTIASGTGGLTLSANPTTLTINSSTAHSGSWTFTLTSTGGFSGLVVYTEKAASGSSALSTGCFLGPTDAGIAANSSVSNTITYSYLASDCTSSGSRKVLASFNAPRSQVSPAPHSLPMLAVGFTGLLGSALLRRRQVWMTGLLSLGFLAVTLGLTGCGSGSASLSGVTPTNSAPKGTYNMVFTAASYPSGSVAATTQVTLVIQ